MNIFKIDNDPIVAARHLVNVHTVKMVLEASQMMSNCFTVERMAMPDCPRTIQGLPRKHCYYNHPCSKWVRASKDNFIWLYQHAIALDEERKARYNSTKDHFSMKFINWAFYNLDESCVSDGTLTLFAQAMPDEYKNSDAVIAYRNYYKFGKTHLHSWKRNKPDWI